MAAIKIIVIMEMKEEVRNHFYLLITISLFFPVFLSSLATLAGRSAEWSSLILIQTSLMVGLYLFDYLIFQGRKDTLAESSLRRINFWLLVAIALFIIPIIGIAILSFNPPPWLVAIATWLSGTAMRFILLTPPAIEMIVMFAGYRKIERG